MLRTVFVSGPPADAVVDLVSALAWPLVAAGLLVFVVRVFNRNREAIGERFRAYVENRPMRFSGPGFTWETMSRDQQEVAELTADVRTIAEFDPEAERAIREVVDARLVEAMAPPTATEPRADNAPQRPSETAVATETIRPPSARLCPTRPLDVTRIAYLVEQLVPPGATAATLLSLHGDRFDSGTPAVVALAALSSQLEWAEHPPPEFFGEAVIALGIDDSGIPWYIKQVRRWARENDTSFVASFRVQR